MDRSVNTDKIQPENRDPDQPPENMAAETDRLWHALKAPKLEPTAGERAEVFRTSASAEQLPKIALIGAEKSNELGVLDAPLTMENIRESFSKLSIESIPTGFASASSGFALIMHGRNEHFQHKFGIPTGQPHQYSPNKYINLSWTDGMLKTAKLLSVPTFAIGTINLASDANKFLSNDHSKALYGTALAFDSLTIGGAAAQLLSKKPVVAISSFGLLGRALLGGVEHFSKK